MHPSYEAHPSPSPPPPHTHTYPFQAWLLGFTLMQVKASGVPVSHIKSLQVKYTHTHKKNALNSQQNNLSPVCHLLVLFCQSVNHNKTYNELKVLPVCSASSSCISYERPKHFHHLYHTRSFLPNHLPGQNHFPRGMVLEV